MLVEMKKSALASMGDRTLVWACIEPSVSKARGRGLDDKSEIYQGLTPGQQALFLFQIFYGHARSPAEFFWFACEYLAQDRLWSGMKTSLAVFGCDRLVTIYGEIERSLKPFVEKSIMDGREITVMDLERDPGLLADANRLYGLYRTASAEALTRMASYIRSRPEEFVRMTDG